MNYKNSYIFNKEKNNDKVILCDIENNIEEDDRKPNQYYYNEKNRDLLKLRPKRSIDNKSICLKMENVENKRNYYGNC